MQFKLVDKFLSGLEHDLVLLFIAATECFAEDVGRTTTQELRFGPQTATLNQCLVRRNVATLSILDEEHGIGHVIEQGLRCKWFRQLLEECPVLKFVCH